MEKNGLPINPSSSDDVAGTGSASGRIKTAASMTSRPNTKGEFSTELPSWEAELSQLPNTSKSSNK